MPDEPASGSPAPDSFTPPNESCGSFRAGHQVHVREPDLGAFHVGQRTLQIVRENRRRQAVRDAVRDLDGFLERTDRDDREHGAEDLFARDRHRGRHAIEHRRRDEAAVVVVFTGERLAAGQ
jgi:hypothetical protein